MTRTASLTALAGLFGGLWLVFSVVAYMYGRSSRAADAIPAGSWSLYALVMLGAGLLSVIAAVATRAEV